MTVGCSGLHVNGVADVAVERGARLWRPAGWGIEHRADVLVIEQGANATRVLSALRLQGVKAVDLVVVRSGGRPQAQLLNALSQRIRIGGVLSGDRGFAGYVRPVLMGEAGMVVRAGGTRIRVDSLSGGRLTVTITPVARGP